MVKEDKNRIRVLCGDRIWKEYLGGKNIVMADFKVTGKIEG